MEDFPTESVDSSTLEITANLDTTNRQINTDSGVSSSCETEDNKRKREHSYTNLIHDLMTTHPNAEYGHFESFAFALYCKDCRMVIQPELLSAIPCKVPELLVQQNGTVVYVHTRCKKLNSNEYIRSVIKECGGDRLRTYWHVWSECHFLSCTVCKQPYPARNAAMCLYHPEEPEYFPAGFASLEHPIGRYPCCGERAFRFETIKNPFGCKFRLHVPNIKNKRDVQIKEIMSSHSDLIIANPPLLNQEKKIMKLVASEPGMKRLNYCHWWTKLDFGENQPISLSQSVFMARKSCDSKKKRKKLKVVKEKCALLDSEQPKLDSVIKEGDDSPVSPPFDNELSDSGFLPDDNNGEHLCESLPSINQDLQKERKINAFEKLVCRESSVNLTENPSVTRDRLGEMYAAIRANLLAKIKSSRTTVTTEVNES